MDLDKGQHLLIDEKILKKEIESAELSKKDNVLEIGAGTGILTEELAKNSGKVLSFEIDKTFEENLKKLEKKYENLKIIYDNALKYSWKNYSKIVSNIPYSLSEPVILKAINDSVEELSLIVGENFKELLSKKETKIGIVADLFFNFEPIISINKKAFNPNPRVNSELVKLKRKNPRNKTEEILRKIIAKKGKIKNAIIYSLVEIGKTKNQARKIISEMKIDEKILEKPVGKITGKFILRLKREIESIR